MRRRDVIDVAVDAVIALVEELSHKISRVVRHIAVIASATAHHIRACPAVDPVVARCAAQAVVARCADHGQFGRLIHRQTEVSRGACALAVSGFDGDRQHADIFVSRLAMESLRSGIELQPSGQGATVGECGAVGEHFACVRIGECADRQIQFKRYDFSSTLRRYYAGKHRNIIDSCDVQRQAACDCGDAVRGLQREHISHLLAFCQALHRCAVVVQAVGVAAICKEQQCAELTHILPRIGYCEHRAGVNVAVIREHIAASALQTIFLQSSAYISLHHRAIVATRDRERQHTVTASRLQRCVV